VVGLAAAWLLRDESVGPQRAIAAALIVAGMACTVIRRPAVIRTGSAAVRRCVPQ
jgi:O-acetylserine/cysteine efflux transporter